MQSVDRPLMFWEQESVEGKILFIVFYTKKCRWQKCTGCNLFHDASDKHVSYKEIMRQMDYLFQEKNFNEFDKLIISNNGSVLDEETFSTTALLYLVIQLNLYYTHVRTICLETRPEYVDYSELEILHRALVEGNRETELEIAVGYELFDDVKRNEHFNKGLSKDRMVELIQQLAHFKFNLKCYFMLKPIPDMSDEEAIADIQNAIRYLDDMSRLYDIKINMHLNPTYVATNTKLETAFIDGEYTPPTLIDAAKAIQIGRETNKKFTIFVGLYDEDLAVEGGSFLRPGDDVYIELLQNFNETQNYDKVDEVIKISSASEGIVG